jgi:hypothetical protein
VRIAVHDLDLNGAKGAAAAFERGAGGAITLDHYNARRAARCRFEAERAAAREKIQAAAAAQILP